MPLVTTPAIVLATWRYRDTSKVLRLATREHGVQSAIARGAMRPKSRFGASLQVLSDGEAQFILRDSRDLHLLVAFDVARVRLSLTEGVDRYASAMALAELMIRFAPPDSHPELFDILTHGLNMLELVGEGEVESAGLRVIWSLISELGFGPSLDRCARDGVELGAGDLLFSVPDGGALCDSCAHSGPVAKLAPEDRSDLIALLDPGAPLPELAGRHASAHRRLLHRYILQHLAEGTDLPALSFWLQRAWSVA